MDWNWICRLAPKIKMEAGTLDEDSLLHCFEDVISLLNVCEEEQNRISRPLIECVINRLESAAKFVENILPIVNECKGELTEAAGNLRVLFHSWCRKLTERGLRNTPNCTHLAVYLLSPPELTVKGGPGRPKYEIDEETLLHFRALGFKWKDIAELLLVSRWTLWRRVRELGITEKTGFTNIGNTDLDDIVGAFMNVQGSLVGYSMVRGHLRSMGINVQRERIRASISRVDPINCRLRWATVVSRRAYSVPGPNSLWHIDGHHSLITWGFVIHGCIDGYSRVICFLKCSTNNRKETVEGLFLQSVEKYSWPSRVRTDHGGENVLVWDRMIAFRGQDRGSALIGSSTRNQRIERLWRDVFRCFGNVFYYTFKSMEESGLLDITNPLHLFVLHYVYLPRINAAIDSFVEAWNKHPIRTERNWSPEQIWSNGMIDRFNGRLTAVADVRSNANVSRDDYEWYGFDPDAPPPPDDGLSTVEVNEVDLNLPDVIISRLTNEINPLEDSSAFAIDIFQGALEFLESLLASHSSQ
ncbi:uncharacterized protein LOC122964112 [Acropora millepora]|uniref:uncharacterized protein LOC122964112 n=1 Tax=Acropora millepora TaxID=45264 RepID=UPI001CF5F02F|nr:uncharacterized protein LOC122964112 [Acropora millepora]